MTRRKPAQAEPSPAGSLAFEEVVAAFARDPAVGQRRLFSSKAVLTVNGKIFAMLVKGHLVVKLPRDRVDALVAGGEGTRFDPGHGRQMKEWLVVPQGAAAWVPLAREAHRFVRGVAPATRRR